MGPHGDTGTLWSAALSAAADRYTMDDLGIPSPILMERAALAVAHEVAARLAPGQRVLALCGPGNNGGDGVAMARILRGWGIDASVHLCAARHNAVVAEQLRLARAIGVAILEGPPSAPCGGDVLVVDALLGTGSTGAPRGSIAAAIEWCNACAGPKVAIDLPSGVDPDTGAIPGVAVAAALTVTMQRSKPGLHITPGRARAGEVVIADIGIRPPPMAANPTCALIDPWVVRAQIEALRPGAHKGERGHVGVVGGSVGTPGAAILTATAALRCGAGLVTIAARDPATHAALIAQRPELMLGTRTMGAAPLPGASVLAVGPGLTDAEDRRDLGELWRSDPRPAVWDASALTEVPVGEGPPAGPRIITPHPGEAARILTRAGPSPTTSAQVQAGRLGAARALARATHAIALLKGEGTLVADPQRVAIAVSGGPGLATAGSGDCLTGFIAALLARGLGAWEAACAGVHLHGLAGELAVAQRPGAVALEIAELAGAAMIAPPGHPGWPRRRLT